MVKGRRTRTKTQAVRTLLQLPARDRAQVAILEEIQRAYPQVLTSIAQELAPLWPGDEPQTVRSLLPDLV
jgi:hypothetical protein